VNELALLYFQLAFQSVSQPLTFAFLHFDLSLQVYSPFPGSFKF
jgi:hypothetical protein